MRRSLRSGVAFRRWFADPAGRLLLRVGFHIRQIGSPPPAGEPCVWACNHSSHFEPLIACACAHAPLHALAMQELFTTRLRSLLFRFCLMIPVDRSRGDAQALREAIRRVRNGQQLLVFPEGGIRLGAESLACRTEPLIPGAAFLSTITGAPIVPVFVTGGRMGYLHPTWVGRRVRSSVYFGELIHPAPLEGESRSETIARVNQHLLNELQTLLKKAQQPTS